MIKRSKKVELAGKYPQAHQQLIRVGGQASLITLLLDIIESELMDRGRTGFAGFVTDEQICNYIKDALRLLEAK